MTYRYPPRSLLPDYLRSGAGLVVVAWLVRFGDLPPVAVAGLLGVGALLGFLMVQVLVRQRTRIELTGWGLVAHPSGAQYPWDQLTKVALSYFSVRRDGEAGWMELKLSCRGTTLKVDSRLEGFEAVARAVAAAVTTGPIALDPVTISNFSALGIMSIGESSNELWCDP